MLQTHPEFFSKIRNSAIYVFIIPSDDSDASSSFRTTGLGKAELGSPC
jgi:hypothetical protein